MSLPTFTLTGTVRDPAGVIPTGRRAVVTVADRSVVHDPDGTDMRTSGPVVVVVAADGSLTLTDGGPVELVTVPGLFYRVDWPREFLPSVTFPAPDAGTTIDLDDVVDVAAPSVLSEAAALLERISAAEGQVVAVDGRVDVLEGTVAGLGAMPKGIQGIQGTGSPNGVVTAPVGSTYIDTAITNGASSWVKRSGTGNTGWKVSEGDTNWRNITSLAPVGNVVSGTFRIRRVNNTVLIRNDGLALIANNTVLIANAATSLGAGFMPLDNYESVSRINSSLAITVAFQIQPSSSDQGLVRLGSGAASYSIAQWSTVGDWPTTLPGTA